MSVKTVYARQTKMIKMYSPTNITCINGKQITKSEAILLPAWDRYPWHRFYSKAVIARRTHHFDFATDLRKLQQWKTWKLSDGAFWVAAMFVR